MAMAEADFVDFDDAIGTTPRPPVEAKGAAESEVKRSKKTKERKPGDGEFEPNVWVISKVLPYKPDREKTKLQQFCADNSDTVKIVDVNTVENVGGYRTARGAFGLGEGASYFEVTVPNGEGDVRAGWSTERGDYGAGVGYDKWQYGVRASDGAVFHDSRRRDFGEPFSPGDVIGCYICLAPKPQDGSEEQKPPLDPERPLPEIVEDKETCWVVRVVPGKSYSLPTSEVLPAPRAGSSILFFKNGKCLGVAYDSIVGGVYYPSVSPFRTRVTVNWGPTFVYPPQLPDGFPEPVPASNL
jgi:hypothetical protein